MRRRRAIQPNRHRIVHSNSEKGVFIGAEAAPYCCGATHGLAGISEGGACEGVCGEDFELDHIAEFGVESVGFEDEGVVADFDGMDSAVRRGAGGSGGSW